MKKLVLVILMSICLMSGGFSMHRIEGANAIVDSQGHRVYTEGPPPTTITAGWLNAVQEEIATVITNAGLPLKTEATETGDQLWQALLTLGRPYDYIVNSMTTFDNVIERVAANQYRIKSEYRSLYFAQITGGYSMSEILNGGDLWGYIETNSCVNIKFEAGAYINMGNERGYMEVNTEGCYLDNVSIRGLNTVASAIAQSFLLNADYVTFNNCNTQDRLSNTLCVLFRGSGTSSHNETATVSNCKIINVSTSANSIYGYLSINNINGCVINNMSSALGNAVGFWDLKNVNNCKIINISAGNSVTIADGCVNINNIYMENVFGDNIKGLLGCDNVNNVQMKTISAVLGSAVGAQNCENIQNIRIETMSSTFTNYGFYLCDRVSNCYVITLDGTNNTHAYYQCNQVSNCYAEDVDSSGGSYQGFRECDNVSNSHANECEDGFLSCNYVTGCSSYDNDVRGFASCMNVSTCYAYNNVQHGFRDCDIISTCYSYLNGINGYFLCDFVTSCKANDNSGDGFNDCDTVVACNSINNAGDGYQDCNHIEHNRSSGNGAAAYNNCFADLAATRAFAATDSGGDNA